MSAFPPYQERASCPKCWSEDIGTYYSDPCGEPGCTETDGRWTKHGERLTRTCQRCRYSWPEAVRS